MDTVHIPKSTQIHSVHQSSPSDQRPWIVYRDMKGMTTKPTRETATANDMT